MIVRGIAFTCASVSALLLCGCGDPVSEISGKVTFNSAIVKGGNVTFVSPGKASVSAQISEDGSYTASNVPYGDVKIAVDTESLNPNKKAKVPKYGPPPGQSAPQGFGSGEDATKRYVRIPLTYAKPDESGLTLTVNASKMQHNIELK
jgi:hypothetical protein